jgi:hypothetical protein
MSYEEEDTCKPSIGSTRAPTPRARNLAATASANVDLPVGKCE